MDATQDDERLNGEYTLSGPHAINPHTGDPWAGPYADVGKAMARKHLESEGQRVPNDLLPEPSKVHRELPSPSWHVENAGGPVTRVEVEDRHGSGVFPERTISIVQSGQTIKLDKLGAQSLRHALRAAEIWKDEA